MEASRSDDPNLNPTRNRNPNPAPTPNPLSTIISSAHVWPTIDGPLGLTEEASVDYARRFYKFGFALLPWLWFVNCFYFWPVLRHARAFPQIRNCKFSITFLILFFHRSSCPGNLGMLDWDLFIWHWIFWNRTILLCFNIVMAECLSLNLVVIDLWVSYSNHLDARIHDNSIVVLRFTI